MTIESLPNTELVNDTKAKRHDLCVDVILEHCNKHIPEKMSVYPGRATDKVLFLNQTLWCDHSLESSRRDYFNEGHIIGIGWEMRKLSWKQFCSLFLNCSPGQFRTSYIEQRSGSSEDGILNRWVCRDSVDVNNNLQVDQSNVRSSRLSLLAMRMCLWQALDISSLRAF